MRAQIHPGAFLAAAIVLSAAWLWLRPAPQTPVAAALSSAAGSARRAAIPVGTHVDRALLQRYAGRYDVEGLAVTISIDGERLIAQPVGFPAYALRASSETKFFFEDFPGEIAFDAGEPARGFVADLVDGRHRGARARD